MTRSAETVDDMLLLITQGDLAILKQDWPGALDVNTRGAKGWTPLIAACRGGHKAIVFWLLEKGADPNLSNAKGTTPLMYAKTAAFGSGDPAIMDALLAAGARIDAVDHSGQTALDYTRQRAEFLINYFEEKGLTA